jgi:hypothetical protein
MGEEYKATKEQNTYNKVVDRRQADFCSVVGGPWADLCSVIRRPWLDISLRLACLYELPSPVKLVFAVHPYVCRRE